MPTLYPKCAPSEVLGFLVILNTHRGSQEIARLAEEENLAIDKILPAVEYAQGLGLLTVEDGRATLTDSGRMLLAAGIQTRKVLLREVLKRTILFRAILRSLEQSVDGRVAEDELGQIVAFTTAPPESIQDIINWGRYCELFRYDVNEHAILPIGSKGKMPSPSPAIPMPAVPKPAPVRAAPKPPTARTPAASGKSAPPAAKPAVPKPAAVKPSAPVAPPKAVPAVAPPTPGRLGAAPAPPAGADASKKKVPPGN